ncbi:MAG: extracellular solute-binding protein [Rhizobiaceae bacterium]
MSFLKSATLLFTLLFATSALADESKWRHGDTLFGKLKHDANFTHYPHANPDAPKGGHLKRASFGGFDSFNPFVVRGRTPSGLSYFGGLLYDNLFEQSLDQPSASYGLVADKFRKADDSSWAVYHINEKARWHDGKPITPEDVIWSMEALRTNYPLWKDYFKNVKSVESTGNNEVTFTFDQKGNRELPHIIGDLAILPKHWWEGTDADGNKRDISNPTKEPPLGSGPYKIGKYDMGKYITWDRVKDYWAEDVAVRKGRYNYDSIRYTYFLDESAMWEAFKKGGLSDYKVEGRESRWKKEYTFPAIKRGDVATQTFKTTRSQLYTGFYFNTRIEKFKDPKVREAITLMFDFETLNKNLFFNLYKRTDSFFEGGELESSNVPTGRELEILEAYRDKLPADLFTKPFILPDYTKRSATRKYQRQAIKLLKEAGLKFNDKRQLTTVNGKPFTIEFITADPNAERKTNSFIENLKRIGITASLRILDTAQYKNRLDNFDFDITSTLTAQSLSPGNEQREYWSSASANRSGSRNFSGIKEPMIDELVEEIILAPDRQELLHLTHALDRILKWRYYAIPQWHNPEIWFAKWKHIQVPEPQPGYSGIDSLSFWIDTKIEAELRK